MADKKVSILLQLVDKASRDFDRVAGSFQSTAKRMSNSFGQMVKDAELGSAAFAAAFGVMGQKAVKAASDAELFRKSIEFLTGGNIQATDKFIQQLNDLAVNTFFSIDQLEEFGKRLLGVTNDTEVSMRALKVLTDTVSATGGGYQELEGATRAFFQTFIKGTPSLEELNRQFTNASIPALRTLAEQLHAGTVELKGYSVTSKIVAGASEKQTKAFGKASENIEKYRLKVEATEKRLQDLSDAGKEGSSTFLNAQASLIGHRQKLDAATNAINTYNKANENAGQVVSTHKKSVEEIMSDLQGISDLGVTGADTARALSKALGIAFGGASQEMMQTFSGQMEQAGENLTFFMRALVGINQDNTLREGSVFAVLRDALISFNKVIDPAIDNIGDIVDSLMKNKIFVLGLAGALTGLLLPALGAFVAFVAPAVKMAGIFGAIGAAVGFVAKGQEDVNKEFADSGEHLGSFSANIGTIVEDTDQMVSRVEYAAKNFSEWKVPKETPTTMDRLKDALRESASEIQKIDFSRLTESVDNLSKALFDMDLEAVTDKFINFARGIGGEVRDLFEIQLPFLLLRIEQFKLRAEKLFLFLSDPHKILKPEQWDQVTTRLSEITTEIDTIQQDYEQRLAERTAKASLMTEKQVNDLQTMAEGANNHTKQMFSSVDQNFSSMAKSTATHSATAMENTEKAFTEAKEPIMSTMTGPGGIVTEVNASFMSLEESASIHGRNTGNNWASSFMDKLKSIDIRGFIRGLFGGGDGGGEKNFSSLTGQHGLVVPGNPTQAVPVIAHGGERIIPRSGVDVNPISSGGGGGDGGASINFYGPVNMDSEQRVQQLADQIIKKLGRQNELARLGVGF